MGAWSRESRWRDWCLCFCWRELLSTCRWLRMSLFSHCALGASATQSRPAAPSGPLGSEPDTDNQRARASLCDRAISALETREAPWGAMHAWGRMTAGKNVISSLIQVEFQIQHRPHNEDNLDTLPPHISPGASNFQFRSRHYSEHFSSFSRQHSNNGMAHCHQSRS